MVQHFYEPLHLADCQCAVRQRQFADDLALTFTMLAAVAPTVVTSREVMIAEGLHDFVAI